MNIWTLIHWLTGVTRKPLTPSERCWLDREKAVREMMESDMEQMKLPTNVRIIRDGAVRTANARECGTSGGIAESRLIVREGERTWTVVVASIVHAFATFLIRNHELQTPTPLFYETIV